jgi:hypothetical protein
MSHNSVLIIDFGSQVTQLIARRIREFGVFCEVKNFNISLEEIKKNHNKYSYNKSSSSKTTRKHKITRKGNNHKHNKRNKKTNLCSLPRLQGFVLSSPSRYLVPSQSMGTRKTYLE